MAIQTNLENVDKSRLNIEENTKNESRNRIERRSSSSYSHSSDDNFLDEIQQESASLSALNEGDDLTEYRLCILNTLSHVILIASILADAVGLSIYWSNTVGPNECMHLYWCEINIIGIYTAFQFVFAFLTLLWMLIMTGCFCFSKDPTKETYSPLSLAGSIIRFLTLLILISCLTFALVGLGNEQIKSLSWNNMRNNNLKKEYRQESFLTYELKPSNPAKRDVYSWDDSIDYYAIFASMTNRIFNLEETKEFLDRYHCDINLPTTGGWLFKLFGYSSNNMACYPA